MLLPLHACVCSFTSDLHSFATLLASFELEPTTTTMLARLSTRNLQFACACHAQTPSLPPRSCSVQSSTPNLADSNIPATTKLSTRLTRAFFGLQPSHCLADLCCAIDFLFLRLFIRRFEGHENFSYQCVSLRGNCDGAVSASRRAVI